MLGEVVFELNVELDEAVHGYCNAAAFNHHHLRLSVIPIMPVLSLRDYRNVPRCAQMPGGARRGNSARLLLRPLLQRS